MKRIDFENGTVTRNIFGAALPMLVAAAFEPSVQHCGPDLHCPDPGCGDGGAGGGGSHAFR